MSEVYEDTIGSTEKPAQKLIKSAPTHYRHESEEVTAKRRAKCLEAIFRILPGAKIGSTGLIEVEVEHRKFELWPASDCWFSHSKNKFGRGIENLLQEVEKRLLKKGL